MKRTGFYEALSNTRHFHVLFARRAAASKLSVILMKAFA
jgi:hypothetical protein